MRICSIASGSSGNCIYVGSDTTHVLIDVGISGKRTEGGLAQLDLSLRDIDGIFLTHEHMDHISGLGVISRKYGIPLYATEGTIREIQRSKTLGEIDGELFHVIVADEKLQIKDLCINPMKISHDAADPVAYRISHGRKRAAVITDLGKYDSYTVESLRGMNALVMEANHDVHMLQVGPYPYHLKQRILGERGHLSNEASGHLLSKLLHDNMQAVFLGHLSKENNLPELAYETVRVEVNMADNPYHAEDFKLSVAKRDQISEVFHIA